MIFKFINKIDVFEKKQASLHLQKCIESAYCRHPDIPHRFDISPHPNPQTHTLDEIIPLLGQSHYVIRVYVLRLIPTRTGKVAPPPSKVKFWTRHC